MDGLGSLIQGAAPQGPQQGMPQQGMPMPMPPQNDPSMNAAMDLATDELDALNLDPRTKAMLKTQEAYDLMQSAQRELAMAQQQPMPPTIEGQRTQQTMQGIGTLMQQLSPGIQQQGQQMAMAQRRSPMAQQGVSGMPANNMMRAARGGIVGYAGPDGSQVKPTLGAMPQNVVSPDQIKQDAEIYQKLEAALAAATTPEDKAKVQMQLEALIRNMGNEHGKVMQYIDSTNGFTTPSSQMAGGGIVGYDGTAGSHVNRAESQREAARIAAAKRNEKAAALRNTPEWQRNQRIREILLETGTDIGGAVAQYEAELAAALVAESNPPPTVVLPEGAFPRYDYDGTKSANLPFGGSQDISDAPEVSEEAATDEAEAVLPEEAFPRHDSTGRASAGLPQSAIDKTLSGIAALTVQKTEIGDLARSTLRDHIERVALDNIELDPNALADVARKDAQGLASQAYAMPPEMKAAYARQQQERDAYYTAQLDPKRLKDQKINALLAGLASDGGIAKSGIAALQGVTGVGTAAAELGRKQSEERFGSAKEREGILREGNIKAYEAGSRMAQSVYERTTAMVNQASQSLSQLATSDETRGQAAAVQEYTRQMDGLKLQLNVFLQQEKISQDDRRNLQRIVADMRNAQSDIDNTITDLRSDMLLMEDPEKTAVTALIQTANVQRGLIQQEIDTTLTSLGIDVAAKPSGGGGERAALPAGFVPD